MTQIQNNLLAIISLVVAITALSYTTYRNELTEQNRNVRRAGFEILRELNKLQLLIDLAHYDKNKAQGNPIQGWNHILYIRDMALLVSKPIVTRSKKLKQEWGTHWNKVRNSEQSNKIVTSAINSFRTELRSTILNLQ